MNILAIETSCDETAAAVYTTEHGVRSNILYSQIELHKKFGGVVPEIASRSHMEKIAPIVAEALIKADIPLKEIDTIGVTYKPGLPGSLLVGLSFAKTLAWAQQKKLVGVNHLEGHAFSASIEHEIPFPYLCLTASGGHTALYIIRDFGHYELIGQTLDDAAGEAFDKVSKLLALGYPGGPIIEKLAQEVDFKDFYTYPRGMHGLNFSFSGLKTAVLYDLVKRNAYDLEKKEFLKVGDRELAQHVASSLLVCITDIFKQKLSRALKEHPEVKALAFVGGVACNKFIRQKLLEFASQHDKQFFAPSPQYCTDNAAMIAFVAHYKAQKNDYSDYDLDIY